MNLQKEILYQLFSLLTASVSIAIVFSILSYNKIAENTYRSIYPYLLQQNYREAFLILQNSSDFNIQKIEYKPLNQKSVGLYKTSTTPFKYSKKLPLFISELKDTSIGTLYIDFNFFPELKTLAYSLLVLTLIFGPLYWKFIQVSQQVKDEKIRNQVSTQIFHDLQSPLLALRNALSTTSKLRNEYLQDVFLQISTMIKKLSPNSTNSHGTFTLNISTFLKSITESKMKELTDCKIELNSLPKDLFVDINPSLFQRSVSNIINNSYEASQFKSEKKIRVCITSHSQEVIIHIEDYGRGIPQEKLKDILLRGVSLNKTKGMGIGLSFAKETTESFMGNLTIDSVLNKGTRVSLKLPISSKFYRKYYLLEDDPLIRAGWQRSAALKGIHLETFSMAKDIYEQTDKFQEDDIFYLDSNLKNGEKGEMIAKSLSQSGYKNLYLVTGYNKERFENLNYIKEVFGKEPIFDF